MLSAIMTTLLRLRFIALTSTLPNGAYTKPFRLTFVLSMTISPYFEKITESFVFLTSPLSVISSNAFSAVFILMFPVSAASPYTSIGSLMLMFISSRT